MRRMEDSVKSLTCTKIADFRSESAILIPRPRVRGQPGREVDHLVEEDIPAAQQEGLTTTWGIGHIDEFIPRFARSPASLPFIAAPVRRHDVFPNVATSTRSGHDVVTRGLAALDPLAAVSANVPVPREQKIVPVAKR